MIIFDRVTKTYGKKVKALSDVSFEIHSHEFVSFVGKSGAGKSTILKLLIGEERPSKGRVLLDEIVVSEMGKGHLPALRRRIGSIFQDYRLLQNKTVYENAAFAMEAAGRISQDIERDVPRVLELVEMKDKARRFPHELSGGEKQRAAIARAIVNRPEILIADEPTGNLDIFHAWDIIKLLLKINSLGTTVLLATHDYDVVNAVGRRVITLEEGRITRDEEKGKYVLSDK
ncbi:MAG: ATP-binding cassette domain-containing protein [bacterium]|nr:ATP-binding cassette domain-containing protein [bacterium]